MDPSRIFGDNSQELLKDMQVKEWPSRRLICLLATEPEAIKGSVEVVCEGQLFVPITQGGMVTAEVPDGESGGRILSVRLDGDLVHPGFLAEPGR